MPHVDPTLSAPQNTSAPDQVTVALATHAGGLRAHHRYPGRPGGLGHPAAPTGTAEPSPRPRAADRPDRASTEVHVDPYHRPAGADHRAHPLDPHRRHQAADRQPADHHGWTGRGPSADHGGHDDDHPGVLGLGHHHHHPAPGDRPDHHGRPDHDRADHHDRPD